VLFASDGSMPIMIGGGVQSWKKGGGSALSMHASIIGSEWDPCLSFFSFHCLRYLSAHQRL
jgi:hypothetical protein